MPRKQKKPTRFKFAPFSEQQRRLMHWWRPPLASSSCDFVVADGAIRSGKTIACIIGFLTWSQEMHSGQSFILAGKTMGALKKNVIRPMLQILEAWRWPYEYIRSGTDANFNPHFRKGSDSDSNHGDQQVFHFNPHFRKGSDRFLIFCLRLLNIFQSTLPQGK